MKKTEIVLMKKILKSKFKMYKITKKKKKNHWEYDVWQGGQEGVELAMSICNSMVWLHLFGIKSAPPTFPNAWLIS